ncbi:hypothetical protein NliqN6_1899 [Naganishia liquefaciens]|uniref:Uncharacterized protein n=1 Tax=Naganishia liquefaciens TaxID=104408 RepID=A0A8H3YEQ9_9TREE|nr:hypothetical protein NliqN6_1899 [Naganishia liquefaciens]
MTSRTASGGSNTSSIRMPRSEMHTPHMFGGSPSQSSSGASSPRRGRARMPVIIMSSQMPRLSDHRKHPYSQLSQSPVSPNLLPKDTRSSTSYTRFVNRSRLAPTDRPLQSPVIQPQVDEVQTDRMPSPLLLPPQRSSTVETLQPLRRRRANRHHSPISQDAMNIDLSGLNNKLGFHVPARETITPRGSDDESEDLLYFAKRRGRGSGERGGVRNSRSLCIEEKALAKSRLVDTHPRQLKNAMSAVPGSRNTGILSPPERRGRSREVKPCSRSLKSISRSVIPSMTVQEHGDDAKDVIKEKVFAATETRTAEEKRSTHLPANAAGSPRMTFPIPTRSAAQPTRRPMGERSLSPRAVCTIGTSAGAAPDEAQKDRSEAGRKMSASQDLHSNPTTAISSPILPPKPVRALSEKTCPTVMKNMVFAPASPVGTKIELADPVSSTLSSSSSLQMPRRSASISLKRIQDQDLETIMGSSTVKVSSPITSRFPTWHHDLEGVRHAETDLAEEDPPKAPSNPASHGPLHWLREAVPKSAEVVPKARNLLQLASTKSPRAVRAASHQIITGFSGSNNPAEKSGSSTRIVLKRGRTASTATEGGDQKRHYTRWDGVETRITEEDHPFHWAVLQRKHELRKQSSRQSLRHDPLSRAHFPKLAHDTATYQDISLSRNRATSPPSRHHETPSRVVSLSSLTHQAVSSLARPVSFRHKSAPLRVSGCKHTGDKHQDLLGDIHRSSISYESVPDAGGLVSLAASFDSRLAYKACKKEEGYVEFDKVLGLDNHPAAYEEEVGVGAD